MNYTSVALYIILTASEIPHKISPIHVNYLIIEEESQIFDEGWFYNNVVFPTFIFMLNPGSFNFPPFHIIIGMRIFHCTPHSWEKGIEFIFVIRANPVISLSL